MKEGNHHVELAPGLRISRVINGLWQIADMERDGNHLSAEIVAEEMSPYLEAGLDTFDMADHYGSAEDIAGAFRNTLNKPGDVKLLTKWVPEPGKVAPSTIRGAITKSLKRLKSEQIDLLQYHAWSYPDPAWIDTLFELQKLKREGLIKHLGVTNFDAAHLRIAVASGIELVSNQVSYSLLDQRASGEMKAVCEEYGVKLLAYGTIAGGFLSERWLNKPEPLISEQLTWSQMKYKRFIDVAGGWGLFQDLLSVLARIAEKNKVSIANIAASEILREPHVAAVIIGARLGESQHIKDNINLLKVHLSQEDRSTMLAVLKQFKAIPGDCGNEYRKPPFLTASGDLSHHVKAFPKPYEVKKGAGGKDLVVSDTYWEKMAGYARAIRVGNKIKLSGTTATHGDLLIGGKDIKAQTHFIIDKIEGAIVSLGGSLEDVDRTRIYVNDIADWEPAARAHGERFGHIQPANTLVEASLVGEGYKVEIEAEATIGG